jgi:hypothetical protein
MKTDILDFPDNLILQLERDRRSYKCFTTDKRDYFKVINGLYEKDSVIDTSFVSKRDLKQLMVDSVINGYTLKLNLIFKEGFHGVVNELAAERRLRIAEQELFNEVAAEILSDSEDENVKVTYEEEIPEKYF